MNVLIHSSPAVVSRFVSDELASLVVKTIFWDAIPHSSIDKVHELEKFV